ncbi:MAG TPA: penicillin-binding protein 2 [Sedimentisphaerales bacterium]|nr:penicillin-binding protein 2 [Sedimentisphaerales bacterium]
MRIVRLTIFLLLLLMTAFLGLGGRCFYLQYFKGGQYLDISVRQQRKLVTQKPHRGAILDCRGRVLAASNKEQMIFAEPRVIKNPEEVSRRLVPIVGMQSEDILRVITESGNPGFANLKEGASEEECRQVRGIYGIGVESEWRRVYPMGRLSAHVVGFTSLDNRGLTGLELEYDKELAGLPRRNIFLADARRRPLVLKEHNGEYSDGVGIILALDATIQQFARSELKSQYEKYEAEAAIAVVAEPVTGAILAMVSLPDFEPNDIRFSDPNTFRNRALSDQFEPGSIIKPVAAAIALDAGIVNRHEKIFCENGHYRGRGFGSIGEYREGFGNLTVREILIKSSNIGMAKIGQRVGREKLHRGLELFGFGRRTGVDLPGETEGLLRGPGQWTGYSVTRIPFGQEITVTAIQLVRAFCILANGGHSVRPYVVRAVVDNDGRITKLRRPENTGVGFVVKPEVAMWIVSDALVGVVNEGTGKRAKLEKWQVFGKTGTANIAKPNERGYSDDDYMASFICGAPAEAPAVVVLVSIRKPKKSLGKGYTGGAVASPVAAKILERTLMYLKVPPRAEQAGTIAMAR